MRTSAKTLGNGATALAWAVAGALILAPSPARAQGNTNSIIYSYHNLSVSGPGSVKALTESEICIFCHTPHFATGDGPLWNHQMSAATYTPYSSGSMVATPGQPTGSSRLCLSCHDGTVALGMVNSRSQAILLNNPIPAESDLGTVLTGDHPISFAYTSLVASQDGNLLDPSLLPPAVQLDSSGQLQCTSCHDPHNDQYGNFLVMDNDNAALCTACHLMVNWSTSAHAISSSALPATLANLIATQNGAKQAKVVSVKSLTVARTGCASCHVPHAAGSKTELARFAAPEKNCALCHTSQGPGQNVMPEFDKVSAHPIYLNAESHSPVEDPVNPPERHVTCVDCHNPHAVNNAVGSPSRIPGSLAGVRGVSAGGTVMRNVLHEYELCFRCHGDSAARGPARVPRQVVQTNTRREFNPSNVSFHPVEATGKNSLSPSLIQPMNPSTMITCTDCHNNDQGPGAGGSGPRGPHGSAYVPLLERMLLLTDGAPYNPDNFALCYKCHSSQVVDSSQTTSWSEHQKHIETYRAACTTCHASHGATAPHLINFNTANVMPLNGALTYTSTGVNHGTCTLTCHDGSGVNHAHNAQAY